MDEQKEVQVEPVVDDGYGDVIDVELYGSEVLGNECSSIAVVDDGIRKLASDMIVTMLHYKGVGLAAPQIGISLRMFVIRDQFNPQTNATRVCINPEVTEQHGEQLCQESCISVPGARATIKRPLRVVICYSDLEGKSQTLDASGFGASVLLHELDHLDGCLFIDRVSPFKRRRAIQSFRKEMTKAYRRAKNPKH